MKFRQLRRFICIALCIAMMSQFIPFVSSATEDGPVITRQPVDTTAALNEDMVVSLEAQGEGLKYQWYWRNKGDEQFQKSSNKGNGYITTMTKARAGREIYCVITDASGNSVTSNIVTLILVTSIPLEITRQPVDTTAALNEDMAISLEAQGEGLKYQWYWRNKGEENFQKSSNKGDSYITTMTKVRNGREVYCVITDIAGNTVTSNIVTLVGTPNVELQITRQPVDTTAKMGEDMAVSLEAQGDDLNYQWYWRNKGEEKFKKSYNKGDSYITTMTEARNSRQIYCVITDALGNTVTSNVVTISEAPTHVMMFSPAPSKQPAATEPVIEQVTEPVIEQVTVPVTEPVIEPITEVVTEPVTEPVVESVTEPVVESVTEPVSVSVTEPVVEPITQPDSEPAAEPIKETVSEPTAEPESEVVDITDKLNALMLKNGAELRRVRKEKGYLYACLYYYIKVTDGGDWDIKRTDAWKFEKGKTYVYQGVEMRMDDPGNIHFGYLGAILFHEEFVCFGAGLNNFMKFGRSAGDLYSYFDDPRDQTMMRWGYRMYNEGFGS